MRCLTVKCQLRFGQSVEESLCSSRVQQPQRPVPTASDPQRLDDQRQRPSAIFLPLDGKEKVWNSAVSVSSAWRTLGT